ncbi:LysR family transcriptional regulator [Saccharothrix algeriensis]|uniref:DNA-binding transcriptional LysR family regulator n=1 Tax=Saccharothrix algeriensis TaxID=173560 RepID=A0A8T8HSK9_9PSEU|nr:LysR family transcriptional regulator [Saccharothrix algeriensis]MBM7812646.1 DNA-binding transcriptional LysR family regulator [Saccharothrix algeriensis]QTR01351.1 LysR family transcriptional regulator [Saccharothrix algeriensis]
MSTSARLLLPAGNQLSRLLHTSPLLLDTTFDQLRTLITVHETRSALRAARALGREQSSVQKQLDTLNRNFKSLCGEPLVVKQGRGKDVLITPTGEALVELAKQTLSDWLDSIHECRRKLGTTLTVGTTRFMLDSLAKAWHHVADDFRRRDVELKVVHIRTKDIWRKLESKEVDIVCGSVVTTAGGGSDFADFDVIEWRRGGLALLTNLPTSRLGDRIGTGELPKLPLVVPGDGLIAEFLRGWFGPDYRNELDIAAEIDEIQYGMSLLRSGLVEGCMIVTSGLGVVAANNELREGSGLRVVELENDRKPVLERLVGVFARKEERAKFPSDHPLNLLWAAFQQEVSD